ncbi:MAG: ABC transporter ATP-binding protein [Chitinophagaceae bacterium]
MEKSTGDMGAITIRSIRKSYGKGSSRVTALEGISLDIAAGSLFGLIGPDGAGKTTLFRILTTLLLADEGSASVNGWDVVKDVAAIRNNIGYMPGRFSLYQDLTVEENLHFFATIFSTSLAENYRLIEPIYVQIEPFKDRRAGKLSGGMKQKLALCCALIHRPKVLFLDEPTTGVDAVSRKEFWEMLGHLRQQGITIMVSTPYMDEASQCDRVALLQNGRIMSVDAPDGIIQQFQKPLYALKAENMIRLLNQLETFEGVEHVYPSGIYHHVILRPKEEIAALTNWLTAQQHQQLECKPVSPTIEDCFMELMR